MSKKTIDIIIETGNDYCIRVKGNQPKLFKQIKENIRNNEPVNSFFKKEKNRGREENRLVEIYDNLLGIDAKWTNLQRIIHVHRYGYRPDKKKDERKYNEHHFYILSKPINDAQLVFFGIRGHCLPRNLGGYIENKLHYVKDVVQNEDKSRIYKGKTIDNLSILKNIVIDLFKLNAFPETSVGYSSLTDANRRFTNKIKKMMKLVFNRNKYKKNRTD